MMSDTQYRMSRTLLLKFIYIYIHYSIAGISFFLKLCH